MVELLNEKVVYSNGALEKLASRQDICAENGRKLTIAHSIIKNHLIEKPKKDAPLKIKFDALASHDITYVGIVQTARASGLREFPVPYVLTNCHNSLCAVGGTINEDDHMFGLSAAVKYGGIYVPPHEAVIHQYMREMMAAPGRMIIGSDSHTRYGAIGTMAVGEGGPELVKQLLSRPYEIKNPEVVCVYLKGAPKPGVGPQDVALALVKATFACGFVKNKVMEFVGPGVQNLSMDYRIGIDVMTTETTCWSSIWETDALTRDYLKTHGRGETFKKLAPKDGAVYDSAIVVDLSKIESMIALPFHPSNAYTIKEFLENAPDILRDTEKKAMEQYGSKIKEYHLTDKFYDGKMHVDQGIIAGCSGGTFENIVHAADILRGETVGTGAYTLSVYPASKPIYVELMKRGDLTDLAMAGAVIKTPFCGPCFGAGDVPSFNGFSIRHTTRNFPNREGSKPSDGQISWTALMDARSIAATSLNKGILTAATDIADIKDVSERKIKYHFASGAYDNRVYQGAGKPNSEKDLKFGPNIADWPKMEPLAENIVLKVVSVITDPVTTTDELIPSGETSSYRSNPLRLAEFALSRKDPEYVGRAKETQKLERARLAFLDGSDVLAKSLAQDAIEGIAGATLENTEIGSVVCAVKPGDGSAREQAASCQRVLGGLANISDAYATKRYRSNLINWGMIPFTVDDMVSLGLENGDRIFVKGIKKAIEKGTSDIAGVIYKADGRKIDVTLHLQDLSKDERKIILAGCLINYYNL